MLILTNCISSVMDEGGMKVAISLARRIRSADPTATLLSCGSEGEGCDLHIPANKLLLNPKLLAFLLRKKEDVLYLPAFARMTPTAIRIAVLSVFTRRRLRVLLVMRSPMGRLARTLLKISKAEIIALSEEAWQDYRAVIGGRAMHLRTGVDTKRFVPVDAQQKAHLRDKYGIAQDKPVVLHVGHLTAGRNLAQLLKIDPKYQIVLVTSSFSRNVKDEDLRRELLQRDNVTLIDRYVPAVEEIYQLSDVYFFPVVEAQNCIDVPLSALEAASCGMPVVATAYGELKALVDKPGFIRLNELTEEVINESLDQALREGENPRPAVLPYDWNLAVQALCRQEERNK